MSLRPIAVAAFFSIELLMMTFGFGAADALAQQIEPGLGVTTVAFGPDGKMLAAGDQNGEITLWERDSGAKIRTLEGHAGLPVTGVCFSPGGAILISAGRDSVVRRWDVATGQQLQPLQGHQQPIRALAVSPDGRMIATGGEDTRIVLWDFATGTLQAVLQGHADFVNALAFSPNGEVLASVDDAGEVIVWSVATSEPEKTFVGHFGAATSISFDPQGQVLVTAGADGMLRQWDVATAKQLRSLTWDGEPISSLAISPDGSVIASGNDGIWVVVWNAVAGRVEKLLDTELGLVTALAFSPDGETLASGDAEGGVLLFDMPSGELRQVFLDAEGAGAATATAGSIPSAPERAVASEPSAIAPPTAEDADARAVADASASSPTAVEDAARVRVPITATAFSPDDATLVVGTSNGAVVFLDPLTGKEERAIKAHSGLTTTGVVFDVTGRTLFSSGRDSVVRQWDTASGKQLRAFQGHEFGVRALAMSANGQTMASGGEDTRIALWDVKTGALRRILSGEHIDFVNALSFSDDDRILVSGGEDGRLVVWSVESGKHLKTLLGHAGSVSAVTLSRSGKILASASEDGTVRLWDVGAGKQLTVLPEPKTRVRALTISPNAKTLMAGGDDGVYTWDVTTGKLLTSQRTAVPVTSVAFSSDGATRVSGDKAGTMDVTDAVTNERLSTFPVAAPSVDLAHTPSSVAAIGESQPQALGTAVPTPPGGPILVITDSANKFGEYYGEILLTEGLNYFEVLDIAAVTLTTLNSYDVAILAEMPLTPGQVTMLTDWVLSGGNLIAMRPDKQLAGLLGLTDAGSTLGEAYLRVDGSKAPGNGIVNEPIQFHGTADLYTLDGAASLATLYSNATTQTSDPAVTLNEVGAFGGQAAAFTFDLARSIVYTRQGNPLWEAEERDGLSPVRSDDKYYGDAGGDPQADWVDLNKVAIPQADEQQRLLANLILHMNLDRKPLPRFWYFPRGEKAVVLMTGDDHGNNGTAGRFDQFAASSPSGCSVENWECIRGTSYIYPSTPLSDAQAAAYEADGFEIALHANTNCADYSQATLDATYSQQVSEMATQFPSLSPSTTQRHHCIAWSDWVTGAKVQFNHGIRLDTSYYYWPPSWVSDRPGFFNGSGMAMRFGDLDGSLIDVYLVETQMTDESGQSYPSTVEDLLDRALGAEGYYGVFNVNAHTDFNPSFPGDSVVDAALARDVPVITSRQLLTWLDGRNGSSFDSLVWDGSVLDFTVSPGADSNGLQAMLPMRSAGGLLLAALSRDGSPVSYGTEVIKGVEYALFPGESGNYVASYSVDSTAPIIVAEAPADGASDISIGTSISVQFSEAMDPATINAATIELRDDANILVPATVSYNAAGKTAILDPETLIPLVTYTASVKGGPGGATDMAGVALAGDFNWSFTTGTDPCAQQTCVIWPGPEAPDNPSVSDPNAVELGVKFRSDVDGYITGIRFYKGSGNTGAHVGSLWTSGGQLLAQAAFSGETSSGWQEMTFATPVAITANTVYVASYHAPTGNYAGDNGYFAAAGVDTDPLHALGNGESGGNGLYAYSGSPTFPSNTYQSSNYWVDVLFMTMSGPDTTPPTIQSTTPGDGAVDVSVDVTVTAVFDEAMDATTINAGTVELRDPSDALVAATVSYEGGSRTARLNPDASLAPSTTYTATVKGGGGGVKDVAGNALAADVSWSFTTGTGASASCPCSIWDVTATPAVLQDPDTSVTELGVKFRSDIDGYITGIRFYKSAGNTGAHVGSLWSSGGQLLAQAPFAGETGSGWQQVDFAAPVAVTANTVYVASYHAPNGGYSVDDGYFATAGVDNAPLHALADGESGANGVYSYSATPAFPTSTYASSNYWVDVVFETTIAP